MNLYEILVPTIINGQPITKDYHNKWDSKVCEIAGGLTIYEETWGHWLSCSGLISEKMIAVKIACKPEEIKKIAQITKEHYQQEVVMVKELADKVLFF